MNGTFADCPGPGAPSSVTITDETTNLPDSRQMVNGANTSIDTSMPGQLKVDASYPNSGVSAGSYTNANVAVNGQGLITSVTNGIGGGGSTTKAVTAGNLPASVPNIIVPTNALVQPLPFDHSLTAAQTGTEYTVPTGSSSPAGSCAGPDGNVWFTESNQNKIAKVTATGTFTEYSVPTSGSTPWGICTGPDGNLWFTESVGNKIGTVTTGGSFTEYSVPTSSASAAGICRGPDGNLWFTEKNGNNIGRITPTGTITEFAITTANSQPTSICSGPDGNLWFAEFNTNKIGTITPAGTITEYSTTTAGSNPYAVCTGPDGNLWFTENGANQIGKVTTSGTMIEFPVPTASSAPYGLCASPDGNLWFCESSTDQIASISLNGVVAEYALPSASTGASFICAGPDGSLWLTEKTANKVATWQFASIGANPFLNSIAAGNNMTVYTVGSGVKVASLTGGNLVCQRSWYPADLTGSISVSGFHNKTQSAATRVVQTGTNGTPYALSTYTTAIGSGSAAFQSAPSSADASGYGARPIFTTVVSVNRLTNCRVWVALVPFADSITGTDTPSPDVLGFRFSTSASDAHWITYTASHSGVKTTHDTGVSIGTSRPDVLQIDASNISIVKFYINGTLVDTRIANLPNSTATFQPKVSFTNLTSTAFTGYNGMMTLLNF